jgi:hypothetical protein
VLATIHRFNQVSQWVKSVVLQEPNLQARAGLIARFYRIIDVRCRHTFCPWPSNELSQYDYFFVHLVAYYSC